MPTRARKPILYTSSHFCFVYITQRIPYTCVPLSDGRRGVYTFATLLFFIQVAFIHFSSYGELNDLKFIAFLCIIPIWINIILYWIFTIKSSSMKSVIKKYIYIDEIVIYLLFFFSHVILLKNEFQYFPSRHAYDLFQGTFFTKQYVKKKKREYFF